MENSVELVADIPKSVLIGKGKDAKIETEEEIPKSIDAPIRKNQIVGKIIYKLNGKKIQDVKVRTKASVDECSFSNSFSYILKYLLKL